jgi:hypothetical protein
VDFVVAVEVTADFKVTEVREGVYGCRVDGVVVAGEGEVETGLGLPG